MKSLMTGQRQFSTEHSTKEESTSDTIPNVVTFGFFISPSKIEHKANVFNLDTGKAEEVDVQQLRMAPENVQKDADTDKKLSVVRELYFYKQAGEEFTKLHPNDPIFPGAR